MFKKNVISDEELIDKILSGSSSAANQLVAKWHLEFCKRANYIVKDPEMAKDVAQKCWVAIFENLDGLRNKSQFQSWAFRIIYHKSIDSVRKRNKIRELRNDLNYENDQNRLLSEEENTDLKDQLLKAIKNLSIRHQVVIRLFYSEDYSIKQLSKTLKISEGTAKSRLYHAREHLKKELNSYKK